MQDVTRYRAFSVWATGAASSAKRSSRTRYSRVLAWAYRRPKLNRLPSVRYRMKMPSSSPRSSVAPLKHNVEEDGEESWHEDAALLHPIEDRERLQQLVAVSDLTTPIFMQLHDHAEKLWWTA